MRYLNLLKIKRHYGVLHHLSREATEYILCHPVIIGFSDGAGQAQLVELMEAHYPPRVLVHCLQGQLCHGCKGTLRLSPYTVKV
jgi:hypothetical protein